MYRRIRMTIHIHLYICVCTSIRLQRYTYTRIYAYVFDVTSDSSRQGQERGRSALGRATTLKLQLFFRVSSRSTFALVLERGRCSKQTPDGKETKPGVLRTYVYAFIDAKHSHANSQGMFDDQRRAEQSKKKLGTPLSHRGST